MFTNGIKKTISSDDLDQAFTSSMVTIVNGNLIYVVHCSPSFRKSSVGREEAGDCVCVHSSSGASFHGGILSSPSPKMKPMGCGGH